LIQIRLALKNDLDSVRKIYRKTLDKHRFISTDSHQQSIEHKKIWVVYDDEDLVKGYIKVIINGYDIKISELAIFPEEQNKGYGTTMVRFLVDKFPKKSLWVETNTANKFYENLGFVKTGIKTTKTKKTLSIYRLQRGGLFENI